MPRPDFITCWGWAVGQQYHAQGYRVLVAERGYIGERRAWTSLGWDGLNGRANFCNRDVDGDRWDRLFPDVLSPWRDDGQYVLLVGQVAGDTAVQHVDLQGWYRQTAEALQERYDMPVLFRAHPRTPHDSVYGIASLQGSLESALADAALVVTFNSTTGVEAVLAGVPVVACDEGSMAWPVAGHDVYQVKRLDRTKWAHRLAWCQWSEDELRSGEAWQHLKAGITQKGEVT